MILDLEMPEMGGEEALQHIRATAPTARVIIHSRRPAHTNAAKLQRAGAAAYVEKPCNAAHMLAAVRKAAHNF